MGPYGEFGRPIALLEAYKEWRDDRLALQEADTRADFPEFLFGPVRTAIWMGYSRITPQWRKYARVESAPDFRERRLRGLTSLRGIGYVGEHGNYPEMRRGERPPASLFVDTYGGTYSVTRHLIINDDSGMILNQSPQEMGYEAGIFVAEAIVALIISNPNAPDGQPFFSVARGNQVVTPLSEDAIADAITFLESQTDDSGFLITVRAENLIVKTARQEMIAKRIFGSPEAASQAQIAMAAGAGSQIFDKGTLNPLQGILGSVVREPFFPDANDWYLFANPNDVPAFAIGFLNGREEPFVGLREPHVRNALGPGMDPYDFEIDKIDFKVRLDMGVAAVDPRGAYRAIVP